MRIYFLFILGVEPPVTNNKRVMGTFYRKNWCYNLPAVAVEMPLNPPALTFKPLIRLATLSRVSKFRQIHAITYFSRGTSDASSPVTWSISSPSR